MSSNFFSPSNWAVTPNSSDTVVVQCTISCNLYMDNNPVELNTLQIKNGTVHVRTNLTILNILVSSTPYASLIVDGGVINSGSTITVSSADAFVVKNYSTVGSSVSVTNAKSFIVENSQIYFLRVASLSNLQIGSTTNQSFAIFKNLKMDDSYIYSLNTGLQSKLFVDGLGFTNAYNRPHYVIQTQIHALNILDLVNTTIYLNQSTIIVGYKTNFTAENSTVNLINSQFYVFGNMKTIGSFDTQFIGGEFFFTKYNTYYNSTIISINPSLQGNVIFNNVTSVYFNPPNILNNQSMTPPLTTTSDIVMNSSINNNTYNPYQYASYYSPISYNQRYVDARLTLKGSTTLRVYEDYQLYNLDIGIGSKLNMEIDGLHVNISILRVDGNISCASEVPFGNTTTSNTSSSYLNVTNSFINFRSTISNVYLTLQESCTGVFENNGQFMDFYNRGHFVNHGLFTVLNNGLIKKIQFNIPSVVNVSGGGPAPLYFANYGTLVVSNPLMIDSPLLYPTDFYNYGNIILNGQLKIQHSNFIMCDGSINFGNLLDTQIAFTSMENVLINFDGVIITDRSTLNVINMSYLITIDNSSLVKNIYGLLNNSLVVRESDNTLSNSGYLLCWNESLGTGSLQNQSIYCNTSHPTPLSTSLCSGSSSIPPPTDIPTTTQPTDAPTTNTNSPTLTEAPTQTTDTPSNTPSNIVAPTIFTVPSPTNFQYVILLILNYTSTSNTDIEGIKNLIASALGVATSDISYNVNLDTNGKYKNSFTFFVSESSPTTTSMSSSSLLSRVITNRDTIERIFQQNLGDHILTVVTKQGTIISGSKTITPSWSLTTLSVVIATFLMLNTV
eukprot:TRINITY_DN4785_c0_g1_i1.p1 TRINITY_DN4785_c0_g1~~TRINITY_DN4785_c0_g1_i1.p1  ORF type:complete len:841 (+),score=109.55 TRINITY_DN4785_c0_g1_i1:147-2669(+)